MPLHPHFRRLAPGLAAAALLAGLVLGQGPLARVDAAGNGGGGIERLAAGTHLAFSAQPSGATAGLPFNSQPAVAVRDAYDSQETADSATVVTLAITPGSGTSGAALTCGNDENASQSGVQVRVAFGVAPFLSCSIDQPGTGYTLTASAAGLASATSARFNVVAPATATPTPSPTATPAPAPAPVTERVGTEGGEVRVGGGESADGGVSVICPPRTFASPVNLRVAVENRPPAGVTARGAVLLPKTVDVTTDTGSALSNAVEIRVNLTQADLAGRALNTVRGGVVVGDTVEPRPTRVIDATAGTLGVTVDHFTKFTLFAITAPGPGLVTPASGETLASFEAALAWTPAPDVTVYHLQVVPFDGNGPAVDLIRNIESGFVVPAPPVWYGLLPDMTYFWRVRTATVTTPPAEGDWSAWASRAFRTPKVSAAGITAVAPATGSTVTGLTPQLTWADPTRGVFYYEVQASKDPTFDTNPATSTAVIYGALIHGGVTSPRNTYAIPAGFPLEPGTLYHWRVRPRAQGDALPVDWSASFTFRTPAAP